MQADRNADTAALKHRPLERRARGECAGPVDAITPISERSRALISEAQMRSTITILALATGLLACDAWFKSSFAQSTLAQSPNGPGTERYAPPRPAPRARTRIRVTPSYYPYRTFSTTYPVPYPIEYPGPGFVRQCTSWLATESRVSGPVVVPRQRCWWQRG